MTTAGIITRIAGPVVVARGINGARLNDVVRVGELGLIGEIIRLAGPNITVQVYEDTSGVRIGEPITALGQPLSVELGPGLLGQVYDGLQRPLRHLADLSGDTIARGLTAPPLSPDTHWAFQPALEPGDQVIPGAILGEVPETAALTHRILVPPGVHGRITRIDAGLFTLTDPIATLETTAGPHTLTLSHHWPVRRPRPVQTKQIPNQPIVTGTRVIDTFFPIARGGSAIIPGGFGTGKTVVQHTLARWSNVDVVVYIGCGERGNEMTEVLEEFPRLTDPRTGAPLMERTVLIANTSNMPVAAREASIYTGVTIAEYFRDMGYDVLLLADSTSRWGEALREISGRLEEMPGEEGYPAYLGSRLARYYERASRATTLDGARTGSVTIVGAVSPPGGDFSEPITQASMRVAGAFWALDYDLSRRRHFPAINWTTSYSLYDIEHDAGPGWRDLVRSAMSLLQREVELQEIVQLVGPDALSESDRLILMIARILREDYLQQSALDPVDQYCPLPKNYAMLNLIMTFERRARAALQQGLTLTQLQALPLLTDIARMKFLPHDQAIGALTRLDHRLNATFDHLPEAAPS